MAGLSGRMAALGFLPALAFATGALAQSPPAFTAAQSETGRATYAQYCAACHGEAMQGGQFGPALKGPAFQRRWGGAPLNELFAYVRRSMPPAAVGQLDSATYVAVIARLMAENGAAAGQAIKLHEHANGYVQDRPDHQHPHRRGVSVTGGVKAGEPGASQQGGAARHRQQECHAQRAVKTFRRVAPIATPRQHGQAPRGEQHPRVLEQQGRR